MVKIFRTIGKALNALSAASMNQNMLLEASLISRPWEMI